MFRNLGQALRRLREERGLSQKEAAEVTGVTPPMLSAYENNRNNPELETLDKILHGLGATLRDLERALGRAGQRVDGQRADGAPDPLRAQAADLLDELSRRPDFFSEPLPSEMEEGYAEILRGLVRVSRVVFESVSRAYQPTGKPSPPAE